MQSCSLLGESRVVSTKTESNHNKCARFSGQSKLRQRGTAAKPTVQQVFQHDRQRGPEKSILTQPRMQWISKKDKKVTISPVSEERGFVVDQSPKYFGDECSIERSESKDFSSAPEEMSNDEAEQYFNNMLIVAENTINASRLSRTIYRDEKNRKTYKFDSRNPTQSSAIKLRDELELLSIMRPSEDDGLIMEDWYKTLYVFHKDFLNHCARFSDKEFFMIIIKNLRENGNGGDLFKILPLLLNNVRRGVNNLGWLVDVREALNFECSKKTNLELDAEKRIFLKKLDQMILKAAFGGMQNNLTAMMNNISRSEKMDGYEARKYCKSYVDLVVNDGVIGLARCHTECRRLLVSFCKAIGSVRIGSNGDQRGELMVWLSNVKKPFDFVFQKDFPSNWLKPLTADDIRGAINGVLNYCLGDCLGINGNIINSASHGYVGVELKVEEFSKILNSLLRNISMAPDLDDDELFAECRTIFRLSFYGGPNHKTVAKQVEKLVGIIKLPD